jgi:LysW-gamma-L-lysine carboxypeptidase
MSVDARGVEDARAGEDACAVRVLVDLVGTPSVSGDERNAVACFVRHAAALGFETEIDGAGSGIATRRGAGVAPDEGGVEILLLGHIDTVPGEIDVRLEADGSGGMVLHGRGSVDAKGPLAAMLVAASRATLPPGVCVRVCAAVGEETPHSVGARLIARTFRPDACIIGEPSGWDGVTLGYKGRLVVRLEVARDSHHSAGPEASASDVAHGIWSRVMEMVARINEPPESGGATVAAPARVFDTIQASLRSMSSGSDGLCDRATLVGGFRLPLSMGPEELEGRIRALIGDEEGVTLACEGHERAHAVDRNDAVVRALSGAIRRAGATPRPKRKTGTSDLNVVAPIWGCPIAAYGPGDSSLDHTPRERLGIDEYVRAIGVLRGAIEALACELSGGLAGRAPRVASIVEARAVVDATQVSEAGA